jgi:ATP-dependent Clp protease ATP-binding subunit ClpC
VSERLDPKEAHVASEDAVELLAREGYDRAFGARIERMVENELSRLVLGGNVDANDRVYVDALEGELHVDVERHGAAASREEWAQPEAVGS